MANTLEIPCAACGALYRMLTRTSDVSVLFRCVHCQEHNIHHLGRVFLLNAHIMTTGTDEDRRAHIRRRMEDGALESLADVRRSLENVVNINVEVGFAKRLDPPGLDEAAKRAPRDMPVTEDVAEDLGLEPDSQPAVGGFSNTTEAQPITDEDLAALRDALNSPQEFWNRLTNA